MYLLASGYDAKARIVTWVVLSVLTVLVSSASTSSIAKAAPPLSVLSPVVGVLRVTGIENPNCLNAPNVWTFCQHQTGGHSVGGGVGQSDDTFPWDANLTNDVDAGDPVFAVAPGTVADTWYSSRHLWEPHQRGRFLWSAFNRTYIP